ncbi:MAG TPA: SDR family oxidoreductase [Steroidobacteraceae bacterium]|jgi:NAD(P)-dependent dehydrogenase (short-subunit alcohol dehydrogenase family)|nr:SDR family oxidoreductase [Steroidobacteraceae bacterium]
MRALENKVAIVTGAGGGIGSATAAVLAARGAKVALADIRLEAAEHVAAAIAARGGTALALAVDLCSEDSVAALVRAVIQRFGRVDILHNNAADLSPEVAGRDRDVESMDTAIWDRTFAVNLRGTMLCCKHVLPHMVAGGGGSIVNTASNLGMQGNLGQAAYAASKAAVIQLTRSIATSHGRHGIRCNTVSPGLVMTPAARDHLPPRLHEIVASETLTPYLGAPEDIAHAVAFLASEEARYLTAHNLVVDGGTAAHVPGFAEFRRMMSA